MTTKSGRYEFVLPPVAGMVLGNMRQEALIAEWEALRNTEERLHAVNRQLDLHCQHQRVVIQEMAAELALLRKP